MMMNDPYQSTKQRDLMIFATNDEEEDGQLAEQRNADLRLRDNRDAAELRKKFSSLEDGEVRDEEDEEDDDEDDVDILDGDESYNNMAHRSGTTSTAVPVVVNQ